MSAPTPDRAVNDVFDRLESSVRYYCRELTDELAHARGSLVYARSGRVYIDLFAGAGVHSYGHNHPEIVEPILDYIRADGIAHALDFHTTAKREFLETFERVVLKPGDHRYRVQFCGPTGTNAVEAALKLARQSQNRRGIFAFGGSFHGVTLGSLAVTSSSFHRSAAGTGLPDVTFLPYAQDGSVDGIEHMEWLLEHSHSGSARPAAVIVECVQAEGGVQVASKDWLQRLARVCRRHEILLICDEIQVGCGRTGPFFAFEAAGIEPDLVTLSKAIGGCGAPMALLLIRPELDRWEPGQHSGTFRGFQWAFVGARAALEYWERHKVPTLVEAREKLVETVIGDGLRDLEGQVEVRGRGMIWGIDLGSASGRARALEVMRNCVDAGVIVERCGPAGRVIKLTPPLNIEMPLLEQGCRIVRDAVRDLCGPRSVAG